MNLFQRTFFAAILAGLIAGLFLAVVQGLTVVPLIIQAEEFEQAAEQSKAQAAGQGAAQSQQHAAHAHASDQAWAPEDGMERTLYTMLFDVLAGVGFGLLLAGGYALRGSVDLKQGLLWGVCGFIAFSLSPALGLPPELPGTESAGLAARQTWWLATVVLTGAGLALIALVPRWVAKLAGLLLLAVPHVIGAPHLAEAGAAAPAELQRQFIVTTLAANALFWLVLGAASGYFFKRFGPADVGA
ncbi:MAG: cobalt transporter [Alphaproteobacteria bacterium]|nr:cobalt transporter [Alphaproteobacteria bacterium]